MTNPMNREPSGTACLVHQRVRCPICYTQILAEKNYTPSEPEWHASRCPSCGQQMRGTDWVDRMLAENATLQRKVEELEEKRKADIRKCESIVAERTGKFYEKDEYGRTCQRDIRAAFPEVFHE